jgi:DNA-binding transcriptional LysR family regulator
MTPSPAVLYARLMSGARLRHLQAFASIAELGSANRAAEAIGLTQPAVTHLISDLEGLLQCSLFHRHARGMRMTDVGQELLPFVRRTLASLEEGAEFVAFRNKNLHSIVRVGAIYGAISGLLVRALPAFSRLKPDIMIELQEANAPETGVLISNREIDLMLCREPAVCPEGWEFSELIPDRFVVVGGPDHPLVAKRSLTFVDLLNETWLLLPPSVQSRRVFDELMAQHGCNPRYRKLKTRSFDMTLAQLQSEPLLTLTPYSVARQMIDLGQLALLDVVDTPAFRPLGVLNPKEQLCEAAVVLKTFLHRFAKQHS